MVSGDSLPNGFFVKVIEFRNLALNKYLGIICYILNYMFLPILERKSALYNQNVTT